MRITVTAALFSWIGLVGVGFVTLYDYGYGSGTRGEIPRLWPVSSGLEREPHRAALVLLAHPRCPCTRASIAELHRIQAVAGDAIDFFVVFVRPDPDFTETDLWHRAAEIPGARVSWDETGELCRRFGAETSGHVAFHDAEGRLVMAGGITPSRGHEATAPGRRAIEAYLQHGACGAPIETPVYGCALFTPEAGAPQ